MKHKLIQPNYSAFIAHLSMTSNYYMEAIYGNEKRCVARIEYQAARKGNLRLELQHKTEYYNINDPKSVAKFMQRCTSINMMFVEKNGAKIADIVNELNEAKI